MTETLTIQNRNGQVDVRTNDAAPRVFVEGAFDILAAENVVRIRCFDIASADADRVAGFENLVMTMSLEAAREFAALLASAAGASPKPVASPAPAAPPAPPTPEERATLYEL